LKKDIKKHVLKTVKKENLTHNLHMRLGAGKHLIIFLTIISMLSGLIANVISPLIATAALPTITRTIGAEDVSIGMSDHNGVIEVTGDTGDVSGQQGIIIIEAGVTVTLILTGVERSSAVGNSAADTRSPIQIQPGANVTIILKDGTDNTFTCNSTSTTVGDKGAGIHVPIGASLTILGDELNTGALTATAGSYSAGIGGGPNEGCGNITITGGTVNSFTRVYGAAANTGSSSANGAGIGGGGGRTMFGGGTTSSSILIGGNAIVTAKSAGNGAGIGGGGSVVAGGAAGIIEISGDAKVTASSEWHGAGIGGGGSVNARAGYGAALKIYGSANVSATSGGNGAGIGGGGAGATDDPDHPGITGTANYGTALNGSIHIYGNTVVTAESIGNGAGIGAGGSNATNSVASTDSGGSINLYGDAVITAASGKNGAGIGGGGSNSGNGGNGTAASAIAGIINFYDNVQITATSGKNGAGIGGGGSDTGNGGNGTNSASGANQIGTINIRGNANINATSEKNGAGIGGGGSDTGNSGHGTNGNGSINIYEDSQVNATSKRSGAGIGGGGSESGNGGGGGTINIYGNPIVVAKNEGGPSNAVGMGPGIRYSNNTLGSAGNRYITSGNVYTPKAPVVTNTTANGNDTVVMTKVTLKDEFGTPLPNKTFDFMAKSTVGSYHYTATTNADGDAYVWLIPGTQLVICMDVWTDNHIQTEVVDLRPHTNTPTTIPIPPITDYTVVAGTVPEIVTWTGGVPDAIFYYYTPDRALRLEAYDIVTGLPIGTIHYDSALMPVGTNHDYTAGITALTALVDAAYPNEYTICPISPPFTHVIDIDPDNNVVKIYYDDRADLTITKTVTGEYGNSTLPFEFSITLTDKSNAPYTKKVDYEIIDVDGTITTRSILPTDNGQCTFELAHGQQIKFKDLSRTDGVKYTVVETAEPGYSTAVDGSNGNTASGVMNSPQIQRGFVNTRQNVVPTGIEISDYPFIAFVLISLFSIVAGFVANRKMVRGRKRYS